MWHHHNEKSKVAKPMTHSHLQDFFFFPLEDSCFVYDELIPSVHLFKKYQASLRVQEIKHDKNLRLLTYSNAILSEL